VIYLAYILSAVCASFVGILLASRIGIGNATQGEGWELQAIASSVIGGTSLFGAVGSVHGPLLGSFILTTINNGANFAERERVLAAHYHRCPHHRYRLF
jgi:ribose transport system permease protein